MPEHSSDINPDQRLDDFDPVGTQLSWPRPVSYRLDQLVGRARGARTDRSEVAAAIIADAAYSDEELVQLLITHRGKRARDVVLDVEPDATVIKLPRPRPGRRKRSA